MIDHKSPELKKLVTDFEAGNDSPASVLVPPQKKPRRMFLALFVYYLAERLLKAEAIIKDIRNELNDSP